MKISKRQLRQIIKEEKQSLLEQAAGDQERAFRSALDSYVDAYMLKLQMNPGDPADRKRVRRQVDDVVGSQMAAFLGEGLKK